MLAGTLGGLLQDVLAGGIVGVGGLVKTLVGFADGRDRHAVRARHGRSARTLIVAVATIAAPADDAWRSRR